MIIFGTSDLYVHLCLLFNSLLRHCFVPAEFCFGVIIPLLKNKHGNVASSDMYRGITLSSTVSKLFESVLLDLFGDYLQSDMLQYGFKKDVGCLDALFTFNESVRYFTSRRSRVFCVSKAFDGVLHSGLLLKLLQKGVPVKFVKFLRFYRAMHVVLARYCYRKLSVRPSVCLSVCPSVTLTYREHIGWTSSKLITRIISLGSSLLGATTSAI